MYYDEKLLYTEAAYKAGNWTTTKIRTDCGTDCGFLALSWSNHSWYIEIYSENCCAKIADHYVNNFDDAKRLFLDIYTAFYHAIENEYIG